MSEAAVTQIEPQKTEVAPQSESAALFSIIERAARDPNVDIEKMERLFAMHERVEAKRAEAAYNAAMSAAQAELVPVVKNKKNDHTKSEYADLYAIADAALPIAHKHGFGLSFSECAPTQPNCMGIACEATHSAGFSKRYTYNIPIDKAGSHGKVNKTDTQAYGSTFTYGRRYATCGVFNIAIKDKDGNASKSSSDPITQEQTETLRELVESVDGSTKEFCAYFKIDSIAALPSEQFERAMAAVKKRLGK